jgi:hypothetical protein
VPERQTEHDAASGRSCPCCKGARGRWQHFEVPDAPDSWDHADGEMCECGPRFDACLACEGTGELVGIERAVLLARGDIAPVQRRGYA